MTFFPITITVYDGFQSTKREMEELMLSFNASKMDIFMKLKLPNALPYFFSAIKMAIPISIIGAASENGWVPRVVLVISVNVC